MAITVAKVTYSLKPETVHRVEELALKWNVPKSEVIRRAIHQASLNDALAEKPVTPLQALKRLQKSGLTAAAAEKSNTAIRRERQAWGRRTG
jgi:predicted transcriptional regulator